MNHVNKGFIPALLLIAGAVILAGGSVHYFVNRSNEASNQAQQPKKEPTDPYNFFPDGEEANTGGRVVVNQETSGTVESTRSSTATQPSSQVAAKKPATTSTTKEPATYSPLDLAIESIVTNPVQVQGQKDFEVIVKVKNVGTIALPTADFGMTLRITDSDGRAEYGLAEVKSEDSNTSFMPQQTRTVRFSNELSHGIKYTTLNLVPGTYTVEAEVYTLKYEQNSDTNKSNNKLSKKITVSGAGGVQVVTIMAPNGSETFTLGGPMLVAWQSTVSPDLLLEIALLRQSATGEEYIPLGRNIKASAGAYEGYISMTALREGMSEGIFKVQIHCSDSNIPYVACKTISDKTFKIKAPTVTPVSFSVSPTTVGSGQTTSVLLQATPATGASIVWIVNFTCPPGVTSRMLEDNKDGCGVDTRYESNGTLTRTIPVQFTNTTGVRQSVPIDARAFDFTRTPHRLIDDLVRTVVIEP